MPNGKRHAIACGIVGASAFGTLLFTCGWQPALACAIGALVGIPLTPDLDIAGKSYLFRRYFGQILEMGWYGYWWAYKVSIPHRSIWSHGPILSTAIRLAYLGVLPTALWLWAGLSVPRLETWMLWAVLGLGLSDGVHAALDWADSKLGGRL